MFSNLKSILSILCLGCIWSTFIACQDEPPYYDKTLRDVIVGEYLVNETNEIIIFSNQGWFNYMESVQYPEDDILGNYVVDEKKSNIIYCTYYVESEDKEVTDTMKLKSFIGTNNTLQVENLPTHNGTTMLLTRQK